MKGIKSEDLSSIVDFLYYGEANIYQDNLDTFLNIAEELELKGLKERTGGEGGGVETPPKNVDQGDNSMMEKNIANKHNALTSQPVQCMRKILVWQLPFQSKNSLEILRNLINRLKHWLAEVKIW